MINKSARAELSREWPILAVATLGCGVGVASLFFYSVGLFIAPLEASFGWSRTALSSGSVAASLALAIFSPLAGGLIDRFGARLIATLSMIALGSGFVALSAIPNSLPIYFAVVVVTSLLATGCSPLVFTRVLAGRFDRARGIAFGIAISGTGVGGALLPKLLPPYIAEHGWRAGYVALAIVVFASVPIIALFLKDASRNPGARVASSSAVDGKTFGEALRSRPFAVIATILGFGALGITGVTVHLMPLLIDEGLTPSRAGEIVSFLGIAIIVGRLCTGMFVDRIHARYVACGLLCAGGVGAVLLSLQGSALAIPAALLVGFAMGAEGDLMGYLVSRYFGMRAYGSIFGCEYAIFLIGASAGPFLAGYLFDMTGTYSLSLLISTGAMAIGGAAALALPAYPPSRDETGEP